MSIVVQKFGGTSVANVERIKNVANIIAKEKKNGTQVIAVVSAMSGVTDQLIQYTKEIGNFADSKAAAEYDTVIAAGEQITAGLLSLALQNLDIKSRSFLGWQLPIVTDSAHANGRILSVGCERLQESIKKNEVPIIAGFQGVHNERIVTLGRGGSDTTAVSVAAAIKATRCDIFTDVEGVFSADPRVVQHVSKINQITYKQMLVMSNAGAKVIHPRAVDIALSHNLQTHILSSFSDIPGTILVKDNKGLERGTIVAVVGNKNMAIIQIYDVVNSNKNLENLCNDLSDNGISAEFIALVDAKINDHSLYLTISKNDILVAISVLKKLNLRYIQHNIAKVTIVGNSLSENTTIIQKILQTLHTCNIQLLGINAADTNITIYVEHVMVDKITIILHKELGLDIIK